MIFDRFGYNIFAKKVQGASPAGDTGLTIFATGVATALSHFVDAFNQQTEADELEI